MAREKRDCPRSFSWTDSDDRKAKDLADFHDLTVSQYFSKLVHEDAIRNKFSISELSANSQIGDSGGSASNNNAISTELISQVAVAVAMAMRGSK